MHMRAIMVQGQVGERYFSFCNWHLSVEYRAVSVFAHGFAALGSFLYVCWNYQVLNVVPCHVLCKSWSGTGCPIGLPTVWVSCSSVPCHD